MPQLQVTTKSSEQVWSSPDGQRKIYKLMLDYEGKEFVANTYSDAISQAGWSGLVETYEKPSNKPNMPAQTFVKQPPKEGASSGSYGGSGAHGFSGKQDSPFTMYLSYAKDILIAKIAVGEYADEPLEALNKELLSSGYQLYDARPEAGGPPENKEPKQDNILADAETQSLAEALGGEVLDLGDITP